ncbi:siderophore iron transporter 1 [Trichomonascus vanleenenianus]|uniref:siderophore iron transporter 1 n=1 Tax=Trichomonascus vanleenenianus TaxID=2268995 RepID=UPI003ECA89EA
MPYYTNYAVSDFTQFSLLSTLAVVQGVIYVVGRPVIAKLSDALGRFEGFLIGIIFLCVGTIILACSPNIYAYFAAQVFYVIGQVFLQFMCVIFEADTSDLVHRSLMDSVINFSYIFVPWTVGPITTSILEHSTWRWGIGMWAIIVPVCIIPLLIVLLINRLKARKLMKKKIPFNLKLLLEQLDIGGSILLAAGLSLLFVAIPLASGDGDSAAWKSAHIIVMIVIGSICLIGFLFYEAYVPKYPIVVYRIMKNPELVKSFIFVMFYYLAYYFYGSYFFSWLLVVHNYSNTAAANVSETGIVASVVSSIIAAFIIKYFKRPKWILVAGVGIHMIGLGLIYHFREYGTAIVKLVITEVIDGFGAGFLGCNQLMVQAYCSHDEVVQTTALYMSFLALGQIIANAVSGAVYRRYYPKYLRQFVPNQSPEWVNTITNDYTQVFNYPVGSPERDGIIIAYNKVIRILLVPAICIYAVMFLITLSYRDLHLDKIDTGIKGVVIGQASTKKAAALESDSDENLDKDVVILQEKESLENKQDRV